MPWTPKEATKSTKKAKTPKLRREWADVANSVRERTGSDKLARIEANGVIAKRAFK
jgi:hypothetical protein